MHCAVLRSDVYHAAYALGDHAQDVTGHFCAALLPCCPSAHRFRRLPRMLPVLFRLDMGTADELAVLHSCPHHSPPGCCPDRPPCAPCLSCAGWTWAPLMSWHSTSSSTPCPPFQRSSWASARSWWAGRTRTGRFQRWAAVWAGVWLCGYVGGWACGSWVLSGANEDWLVLKVRELVAVPLRRAPACQPAHHQPHSMAPSPALPPLIAARRLPAGGDDGPSAGPHVPRGRRRGQR